MDKHYGNWYKHVEDGVVAAEEFSWQSEPFDYYMYGDTEYLQIGSKLNGELFFFVDGDDARAFANALIEWADKAVKPSIT